MSAIEAELQLTRGAFSLDAHFTVPATGVTVIHGASGAGKTTLLRVIAGLEQARNSRLRVGNHVWLDTATGIAIPPHRRSVGYVFQETALFSHLTVKENLRYGLNRKAPGCHLLHFDEAVMQLGLDNLLGRRPGMLSGGERQRVAIARALLSAPELLLMDEPLHALDDEAKGDILRALESIFTRLPLPVFYVCHARDEMLRLADRVLWLEAGHIRANLSLPDLLANPTFSSPHRRDAATVFDATVEAQDEAYQLTALRTACGLLTVPRVERDGGQRVRIVIHARDVSVCLEKPERTSILNILPCHVISISEPDEPVGILPHCTVRLDCCGMVLLAHITRKSADVLALKPGMAVYAQIKSVALVR